MGSIPKAVLAAAGCFTLAEPMIEAAQAARSAVAARGVLERVRDFHPRGGRLAGAIGPEVKLLGSLPAVTPNTKQTFLISGTLPDGYELRGILIDVNMTFKSAATAFALAAADHNTIASAIIARLRMKAWGMDNAYSLTAPEGRTMAVYMSAGDPFTSDPCIPTGRLMQATGGGGEQTPPTW